MRFLRNLFFGYKAYFKAIKFIHEQKLYWYFLIPAGLMLVIYKIGDMILNRHIDIGAENMNDITWYLIQVVIELTLAFLLMKFAKYLVVVILSPLLSSLSMKTEKILTGNTYPFDFKQLISDIKRAVRIVVRNLMWEYTIFVVIYIISLMVGGSEFAKTPVFYLTFLVGCFYYGFGFLDYINERRRLDMDQSIHFVRDHRGMTVAIGSVYSLLIFVPVDVGILFDWSNFEFLPFMKHLLLWLCASVAPILAIIAATIAMDDLVDLKTNVYSQKIDNLEEKIPNNLEFFSCFAQLLYYPDNYKLKTMSQLHRIVLGCLFIMAANFTFGAVDFIEPKDSTSKLIDRSAALVMLEDGKTKWGEGKVRDALIKFRQASVKDPYSWRPLYWIGKCHYRMDNYGYALKYVKDALDLGKEDVNNELYYLLAMSYHRNGDLDNALENYQLAMEKLSKMRVNELNIQHNIDEINFAKTQLESEAQFERTRMKGDINSGYHDYNLVLSGEDSVLYFVSRRSNTTGGNMNPDDQLYFEDTYRIVYDEELQMWDEASNQLGKMNSEGFDCLNWMSPDGLWAVITLNNTAADVTKKKQTRGSDICIVKKNKKGTWNSAQIIDNKSLNTSFFEGAATLTADGNVMYFVTDRKGDKKSTDIWMIEKKGKAWGTAQPLPDKINTKGRETTPYITPDGQYLFFSSNGQEKGMGGTDIYVTRNMGGEWSDPVNLGNGINTVNNDTHFVYDPDTKKGYVAGLELSGNKASIDLYEIDMSTFEFPE